MADKLEPKDIVTFEELLRGNTIAQEALINMLDKRGLVKKQDLLVEIKRLKKEQNI